MDSSRPPAGAQLSISELPSVLTNLFTRAEIPLLPDAQKPLGLFVRYLRRKPARGLAVIYAVDELNSSHKKHAHAPDRAVSLTVDEQALDGASIRFNAHDTSQATLQILPAGVLRVPDLGISVQAFPADDNLPDLALCFNTHPSTPLFEMLQATVRTLYADQQWDLITAVAEPVRYKPANRCVIRYRLELKHPSQEACQHEVIFGKVYADHKQALSVQQYQQLLYTEQEHEGLVPLLPRPLGIIDTLGLTFNEAVQPGRTDNLASNDRWQTLRTGTRAFQPQIEQDSNGTITRVIPPAEELTLTGHALARIHTSTLSLNKSAIRSGKKEAKRSQERAALIAGKNPLHAQEVQRLVQLLSSRLEVLEPDVYRPAHGGFKASQLLFHSHNVFVVDFDGFCLADPALDVGYFLAYLRPSGLWYHRQGTREWFEASAALFREAYREGMSKRGVPSVSIDGILDRSHLYEAALLFKIATRRVNRLNSPRPQELGTMLSEIATVMA